MYIVHFCYIIYIAYVCVIDLLVMLLLQYGHTPLDLAHDCGHHEVAEFLLTEGGKVKNCEKVSIYVHTK